jgi:NAD(P)-dependent dehydrogenase (short-subunit alcohol dehydrogenase family)
MMPTRILSVAMMIFPLYSQVDGDDALDGGLLSNNVPLGRLGTPDEIAKAVVFLASDDSRHVAGMELFVGAGFAQV